MLLNFQLHEAGEVPEDLEGIDDLGEAEAGAEEETGEQALSEAAAEENVEEAEAAGNKITLSTTDYPQLENLQPGDPIDILTTYKVLRAADGQFDLEPTAFLPPEDIEGTGEAGELPPTPEAAGAGGGGLAGALGGPTPGL